LTVGGKKKIFFEGFLQKFKKTNWAQNLKKTILFCPYCKKKKLFKKHCLKKNKKKIKKKFDS